MRRLSGPLRSRWLPLALLGVVLAAGRLRRQAAAGTRGESGRRSLWMFNHYALPPDMPGGTRHFELASLLRDLGWDSTIFAAAFGHPGRQPIREVTLTRPRLERDESGVRFVWLYTVPYLRNDARRYLNMTSFIASSVVAGLARRAPDTIIGSSPHPFAALSGLMLARWHRVPFVLEVRDLWPESLVQLGLSNRPVVTTLELVERLLYRNADHILALTEGIADGIAAKGIRRDRISLVSNAAMRPEPLDSGHRHAARAHRGWSDRFVVIWIGAHGPANGLDVLVDAATMMAGCPDVHVVLVGEGHAKPDLVRRARDLTNIEFLDAVPKAEVQELLWAADVGVIVHRDTPAVRGARPNKLFDYMAAGLPILLNLDGEARRLVEQAGAGLWVEPESAPALVDGVRYLKASLERRGAMSRNGFEQASRAHSREDTAIELAHLLNDLPVSRTSRTA